MKTKDKVEKIVKELKKLFPKPKCELDYETPFQLLSAVILSAQAMDKQVNKATPGLFLDLKEPICAIKLGQKEIRKRIKTIGLNKAKSSYIYNSAVEIKEKYNSIIPQDLKKLTAIKGIGIKTAKVVLAEIYGLPYLAVDVHVHRVLNRLGIVSTKTAEATDKKIENIFSDDDKKRVHHSLVLFGRYHCKSQKPECKTCPMVNICKYTDKKN